jgi:palmitoyl-protein thioesterase
VFIQIIYKIKSFKLNITEIPTMKKVCVRFSVICISLIASHILWELGYLEKNRFLPYLNNEKQFNSTYKENMKSLNKFIMIRFAQDVMIKPAYTAVSGKSSLAQRKKKKKRWDIQTKNEADLQWFWVDDKDHNLIPLNERELYKKDWLGLKYLDEQNRLEFLVCPGQHVS